MTIIESVDNREGPDAPLKILIKIHNVILYTAPARSSRFKDHGHFSVIISTVEIAEQRSVKMAFSYDLFIIIIIMIYIGILHV